MNKKMKMLAFIIFFIVIAVLGYVIYSNATKNEKENLEEKVLAEVNYLEVKIINMANRINNITTQNYKVTTKEVEEQSGTGENSRTTEGSSQDQKGGESQEGETSESKSDNQGEEKNSNATSDKSENMTQEYNMERINELSENKEEEINWDNIQKEIEEIYTVMPTITLDLYQTNINQEDILKFNNYLDELAINSKNKEEKTTLENINNMYACITKFIENTSNEEEFKITIKAKENVLIAYRKVTLDEWEGVENDLQNSIDTFSVLLTNTNIEYKKQININKIYVILNELKNVAGKKDKDVFFIKYKNLLEEMGSM